jgi:pimeloyl-ACP methyl ester carboxylesterase
VELKARSHRAELLSAFAGMRKDAEVFIDVLGLNQIDLLGFSVGGIVAQQIVVDRSERIIDN